MHDQQVATIDAWIAMQEFEITRPEAIRRLVERELTVVVKSKQAPVERRVTRARELAGKAIEKVSDPSASPEQRMHSAADSQRARWNFAKIALIYPKRSAGNERSQYPRSGVAR